MDEESIKEELESYEKIIEKNCHDFRDKLSKEELEVYCKYNKLIVVPEIKKDEKGYPRITYNPTGEKTVINERYMLCEVCAIMDVEYFTIFGENALVDWQLDPENQDKSLPQILYDLIEYNQRERLRIFYINRGGLLGLPNWDITNPWVDFENFINYISEKYLSNPNISGETLNKWDWIYGIKEDWKEILVNRFGIDFDYKPHPDSMFPEYLEFLRQGYI